MMGIMLFLTILVASSAAVSCPTENVKFKDEFKSWDPTWGIPTDSEAVKNGRWVMRQKPNYSLVDLNQAGLFQNGQICGEVMISSAGDLSKAYIGLVFWAVDINNYYALLISPDGRFTMMRRQAGQILHPIDWQHTDAIKPGIGKWNELSARLRDNHVTLSINGIEVGTLDKTYPPPDGGMIGIFIESGSPQEPPVEGDVRDITFSE